jgi:hypothetical protein
MDVIKNVSTEDFFNYCRLEESGVTVTSGTDLPLFITDIPESIIRAVFRRFPEGEEVWGERNKLHDNRAAEKFYKQQLQSKWFIGVRRNKSREKRQLSCFQRGPLY